MARIEALLSVDGYSNANKAFQQYWSGDHQELLTFIESNCPPNLEGNPIAVLSVGAGDGGRDAQAIEVIQQTCQPSEIHFTALEPNGALLNKLQIQFADNPHVTTLKTVESTAEDFDFEANSYDIIMYTHSLYHMPGAERDLLKKSVDALKPDGRIIIALSTEAGGIFQMMGAFWQTIDYSHFETGDGLFGQETLLKILEEDYSDQFEFKSLPDVYIDMQDSFDSDSEMGHHLLNFVMQSDTSKLPEDVLENVIQTLDGLAPTHDDGSRRLPHGSGVAVIYKS